VKTLHKRLQEVGMEAANLAPADTFATMVRRILAGESVREQSREAAGPLIAFAGGADRIVRLDIASEPAFEVDERIRVVATSLAEVPEPGSLTHRVRAGIFADFVLTGLEPVPDFAPSTASLVEIIRRPLRMDDGLLYLVRYDEDTTEERQLVEGCIRFADVTYAYRATDDALLVTLEQYVEADMMVDPDIVRLFALSAGAPS
jgi:hypothetical protein